MSCVWLSLQVFLAVTFAGRIPLPRSTETPELCGKGDISLIRWCWGLCKMALGLEALWDRDNFFCLLCLLTAWQHDNSWTGLLDHKQIRTNSSGQLKNRVASQSGKWDICAVVNSPHSDPHPGVEIKQFAIHLQKYNWISLLCYHCSISWYWEPHQNPGRETPPHPAAAECTQPGKEDKTRLADTCGHRRQIGIDRAVVSGMSWKRDPMYLCDCWGWHVNCRQPWARYRSCLRLDAVLII